MALTSSQVAKDRLNFGMLLKYDLSVVYPLLQGKIIRANRGVKLLSFNRGINPRVTTPEFTCIATLNVDAGSHVLLSNMARPNESDNPRAV